MNHLTQDVHISWYYKLSSSSCSFGIRLNIFPCIDLEAEHVSLAVSDWWHGEYRVDGTMLMAQCWWHNVDGTTVKLIKYLAIRVIKIVIHCIEKTPYRQQGWRKCCLEGQTTQMPKAVLPYPWSQLPLVPVTSTASQQDSLSCVLESVLCPRLLVTDVTKDLQLTQSTTSPGWVTPAIVYYNMHYVMKVTA